MLLTSHFFQLAPSVVQRIRNAYRTTPRTSLPTRLSFLENYGVDSDKLDHLRSILVDVEEERLAAAFILLRVFKGQTFHASAALTTWVRRKVEVRPELKEAAVALAEVLIVADTTTLQSASIPLSGEESITPPSPRFIREPSRQ